MKFLGFLLVLVVLYIYHPWFFINKTLSSGDWPFLFLENIKEFSFLPNSGFLWLTPYYQSSAKTLVEYFGLNWNFAEKILWFWPFLILSITSSFYLTRSWIGVLIYTASTYPLMLVGGGQMGVAIAYSMSPLILRQFIDLNDLLSFNEEFKIQNSKFKIIIQNSKFLKKLIIAGLILAAQVMFDPRITYITFIAVFSYLFLSFILNPDKKKFIVNSFFLMIPLMISLVLNSFWIISILRYGVPSGLEGYSSILGFQFLSFADFSHTISALHPNWPENIFGKVYFMRSEFVLLPILAYSSLLFIKISNLKSQNSNLYLKSQNSSNNSTIQQFNNKKILFFALLGLLGAFLAKGSNPPFGGINEFLFQYFPGMSMFRDPTKFYLLILLSYSILIPFSIYSIQMWLNSKVKTQKSKLQLKAQNFKNNLTIEQFSNIAIFSIFLLYLLFLVRPAVMGELGGTFKPHNVPQEYIKLKDFFNNQPQSFKILWILQKQRFGFSSLNHPAVNANEVFATDSVSLIVKELNKNNLSLNFSKASIEYLVIPFDSEKEIFLKDRKYNEEDRNILIKGLKSLSWLKEVDSFEKIKVFQVIN